MHFNQVYDYTAGKEDWISAGFPIEGGMAEQKTPMAGDALTRDVATCRETDTLGNLRSRRVNGKCVVLNSEGIVLGRITSDDQSLSDETTAEQVAEPGPTTIRPGTPLAEIVERMKKAHVDDVLVSTAEGRFLGILYLEDAESHMGTNAQSPKQEV